MNNVSYDSPRPDAVRDLSQALAAQQARQPAGSPATEELARDFLARMQRDIDEQVDLRVQQQLATWKASNPGTWLSQRDRAQQAKEVMLGSLGIGVPLTIGAGIFGGIWGIVIVWVGLIIINVAWARRS
jgi:hypothetical protein